MEDMAGVGVDGVGVDEVEVASVGLEVTLLGGVAREAVVKAFDFLGVDLGVLLGVVEGLLMIGVGPRLSGQVIVYVEKMEWK